MGRDKALTPFLGRPLIERVIERVSGVADELIITSNMPEDLTYLGIPIYRDLLPERGALGGLLTAFTVAMHEAVAIVACDMAFVNAELLRAEFDLLEETGADAAVPRTEGGYEPFCAVYRRDVCRAAVEEALAAGRKRADAWYPAVRLQEFSAERIREIDPLGEAFVNVNTPEELAAAEARARSWESGAALQVGGS